MNGSDHFFFTGSEEGLGEVVYVGELDLLYCDVVDYLILPRQLLHQLPLPLQIVLADLYFLYTSSFYFSFDSDVIPPHHLLFKRIAILYHYTWILGDLTIEPTWTVVPV